MAKWLNKYFSLGNNKTKSPPAAAPAGLSGQAQRDGGGGRRRTPQPQSPPPRPPPPPPPPHVALLPAPRHQRPAPRLPRAEGARLRGPVQRARLVAAQAEGALPRRVLRARGAAGRARRPQAVFLVVLLRRH
ncbi:SH2 domain-containing adapter protein B [Varanus komodoensis]|nr:SH2 domain-containing adapter protein B [Varanus komodoensis]